MSYQIECLEKEALPVVSIRTRAAAANLSMAIGEAYQSIMGYLGELGEEPAMAPFTAYHNMDMNDLDLEIGFPVKKAIPAKGNIKSGQIPAGKQVSCLYKGSYENMKDPYDAMEKWMMEKGLEATGTAYEFYLNSPQEVPPQELQTIIMFPVK